MKKNSLKLAAATLVFFLGVNVVNAQFPDDVGEYASADAVPTTKVTVDKPMPFWVYPDAVYNPDWTEPAATGIPAYVTVASITDDVISSFTWTTPGTPARTNEDANYVELQWGDPGTHLVQVYESPAGGAACDGAVQDLTVQVIDVPYVRFDFTVSTVLGLDNVMVAACAGDVDLQTAIEIAFGNENEENPYHINLGYNVYDVPIDGGTGNLDWTNRSGVDAPAGLEVFGQDGTAAPSEANPVIRSTAELVPERTYTGVAGSARVYEFELAGWNAKISRKSDYISLRTGSLDPALYENYVYHNVPEEAEDVLLARIVVLPAPVTGPIYHIPNSFGL